DVLAQVGVRAGDAFLQGRFVGAAAHDEGVEDLVGGVFEADGGAGVGGDGVGVSARDPRGHLVRLGVEVVLGVGTRDVAVEGDADVVDELSHTVQLRM